MRIDVYVRLTGSPRNAQRLMLRDTYLQDVEGLTAQDIVTLEAGLKAHGEADYMTRFGTILHIVSRYPFAR